MSDRRLQVFQAVAKSLSFTRAADALGMTQPAVTFQVRQLEEQLQARLFDRGHNRITLTPAGKLARGYAERICELYRELETAVADLTGEVGGQLCIGASTTIAEYVLPAMLGEFKRSFPAVSIALRVGNTDAVVGMVEEGRVDVGVVEGAVSASGLETGLFRRDRLVVVMAPDHPLSGCSSIAPAALRTYPFILREEGSGTRGVVLDYLAAHGLAPETLSVALELGSPESIKGAVEAGMGLSILSSTTLDKELRLGVLTAVDLSPPLERPFYFVRRRGRFACAALVELLAFAGEQPDAVGGIP